MRLNKYIANSGVCSRRAADKYILEGRVKVNSIIENNLGIEVDEINDVMEVDNKVIKLKEEKKYIMLNKPRGYVTTVKEQFDRPSVIDIIKEKTRVYPVGRLDMYTTGLLLLTNDGEFTNKLTHPKNKVAKTYLVEVNKTITDDIINNLEKGVDIGDYITKPAKVKKINPNKMEIIISEGKNRQVRKMCESQGLKVIKLKRTKVGKLSLGNLKEGEYRYLKDYEVQKI